MELHTLGVDGGYTQKDIQSKSPKPLPAGRSPTRAVIAALPRMMIKGTEDNALNRLQRQAGVPDDIEAGEFYFNENWHDDGEKTVLGQKINEGGIKDGLKVIDILVKHPSTAKFIARKLAVKFVSDNPSEALVGRVAEALSKIERRHQNDARALFTDEEFFAPENYRAKIKTPFELAVSAIRTHRRRHEFEPGDAGDAQQNGRSSLRLSGADRLPGHGRRLGKYGRACSKD